MKNGKLSAIHNLVITAVDNGKDCDEGLILDEAIMAMVDIRPGEAIILTRVGGDNWSNRMRTRVIPTTVPGAAICQGGLVQFLSPGDLTGSSQSTV